MDDAARPPAPAEGKGPSKDGNEEQTEAAVPSSEALKKDALVEAPPTIPVPSFELAVLRGWMAASDDDDDDDETAGGRGRLDTIPLPSDELHRLMVLTRGHLGASPPSGKGLGGPQATGRDRFMTLTSAEGNALPLLSGGSAPRAMRGVEILLQPPSRRGAVPGGAKGRAAVRGGPRWVLPTTVMAIVLLPAMVIALGAYVLQNHPPGPAPSIPPTAIASAPISPESAAEPVGPPTRDADARAALLRLRSGIMLCVRNTIGVLPGTSPPIPTSLRLARGDGYVSSLRDWATPVWSCAGFGQSDPQRFQIQWQIRKSNVEGMGVAWIDEDNDGMPDRALGFRMTLKGKGQPEAGDIEVIDPAHPVASPAR